MFTGIVEELGVVEAVEDQGDAVRLTVRGPHVVADAGLGDSIAVNGCCLTVAARDHEGFTADVMRETLEKTTLGALAPGGRVNLERAVTAATRLGGHIVQGHVDATGAVVSREPSEHWELVTISMPRALARYLVPKGSITTWLVVPDSSVVCPPITPAIPIGPVSSVISRSSADSVRFTSSRVVSVSPSPARRTTIGPDSLSPS